MKRKGVCPVEPQRGACGVWLDASALKKRKVQTLMPLRVLNRRAPFFPPRRSPLPCTKQTSISTFFSVLQAGERRASTSQRLPTVGASGAPLPEDHKQPHDLCLPPPASAPAQSDARWDDAALEREAWAEGEDLLSVNCTQAKGDLQNPEAAISPLRERNGARVSGCSRNWQPFAPSAEGRGGFLPSWSDGCFIEDAESENADPHLKECRTDMGGSNQPVAGLCLRPKAGKSNAADGRQESRAELAAPLFSQDSEGRTVISHRFAGARGKPPLQEKPLWRRSSNSSKPPTGFLDTSPGLHYDSLFTEDSEGNRVIKH